jgi:hypothetical protein
MFACIQVAEYLLEAVFAVEVVIILKHRKKQRLSEFARTDEKLVGVGVGFVLQCFDETCLVDIGITACYDVTEIRFAVRQTFEYSLFHCV